ncbi:MAG: hypothetical protein PVH26_05795 [Desulfosarcina sp.]
MRTRTVKRVAHLPWVAAGMGLLVSPDHLRMWGNLAGRIGPGFWIVALGAAAVYSLTAASYRRLLSLHSGDGFMETLLLKGGIPSVALSLASRLVLTTGISTGVLVSAGFVFNETFVYWFPNFGFAFIGLACVVLALSWSYTAAERLQVTLLIVVGLGLGVLTIHGLWQTGPPQSSGGPLLSGVSPQSMAAGLLLFVGFDLGIHHSNGNRDLGSAARTMLIVLCLATLLFSLWGTASLLHVPARRLADTFIPYTLAARTIGDQPGRLLMAVVVIAGSVCAATTLFTASARMIGALAQLDMLPRLFRGSTHRNIPAMAMLAAAVGAMMALGFAGSMHLEIFIRAGFLLWLLHTALIHGLAWGSRGVKMRDHGQAPSALSWLAMPAAPILGVGAAILWATDVDRLALLIYLSTSWCLATVVVLLAKRLCRRGQQQPIQPATPNPP